MKIKTGKKFVGADDGVLCTSYIWNTQNQKNVCQKTHGKTFIIKMFETYRVSRGTLANVITFVRFHVFDIKYIYICFKYVKATIQKCFSKYSYKIEETKN